MPLSDEVKTHMRADFPSVDTKATLREVIEEMVTHKMRCVIVKENEEIVGIIRDYDVFSGIAAGRNIDKTTAGNYMDACKILGTNICPQLFEENTLEDAMKVMAIGGISELLIRGPPKGRVTGIITSTEILKALVK